MLCAIRSTQRGGAHWSHSHSPVGLYARAQEAQPDADFYVRALDVLGSCVLCDRMPPDVVERSAGQFAQERYEQRRRAWLRRVWWAFPLVGAMVAAAPILIAWLLARDELTFFVGLGIGAAVGMVMTLALSPPGHIERWREGAEGERATAKALRPLTKAGWVLVHDIQTGHGNIDHVLIGPPGVFMLETKKLGGLVSVDADQLTVRWRDAPDDGYVLDRVGSQARGRAAALHDAFRAGGVRPGWLQAVVVLWSTFDEQIVEHNRTIWIHGTRLVDVLTARPTRLSTEEIAKAATLLRSLDS